MKELSIEEKAQRYDEAIERLRNAFYDNNSRMCEEYRNAVLKIIEPIFPELKSEYERIRKELIDFVKSRLAGFPDCKRFTDWLEKQVEQKHTDNTEPKFKVGDFIVNDYCMGRIVEITNDAYLLDTEQGIPFSCEHNTHLWTIQDAKDGDVLVCESGWTCIFKTLVNDETFSSYCFMDNTKWFYETGSECHTLKEEFAKAYNGKIYPATKEQRDLLFQKMHEAGYEWDAEKKELREIEQKPYPETLTKAIELYYYSYGNGKGGFDNLSLEKFKDIVKTFVDDYGMQKPAWSEEDEKMVKDIIASIDTLYYHGMVNWLKSLKDRVLPKLAEWDEEDEEMYKKVETAIDSYYAPFSRDSEEMSEWLKNLKDKVNNL